ncbi:hypothetical protein ACSDR0_45460 [Streptosporangium sp. G11]|uniref:hypothetical protein n=1 Tax=Streptosporangium sp. G11 TaxID=3436926 RepID=UPI003EB72ECB
MRLLLLPLLLLPFLAAPAHAAALTGGKAYFVVALGHLRATSHSNWVSLGSYTFGTNGSVSAAVHHWSQTTPVQRTGTGAVPSGGCSQPVSTPSPTLVRPCEVLTAGGFMGAPNRSRTGTFGVADGVVTINWTDTQGGSQQWYVTDGPKMAALTYKYDTKAQQYGQGYGFGSNSPFTERRAMSSVRSFPGTLKQDLRTWAHDQLGSSSGQTWTHTAFTTCTTTTWCLTYRQPNSSAVCQQSGCPGYGGTPGGGGDSSLQNYVVKVSSYDRRDTYWHWCTCLAKGRGESCYTGNSHVKPMLQILDDDGAFHGWVGVEASFSSIGAVSDDMLGVFRLTHFRP